MGFAMRIATVLLLLVALGTLNANAQTDIATDAELLAAYCLGHTRASQARPTVGLPALDDPIRRDNEDKGQALWGLSGCERVSQRARSGGNSRCNDVRPAGPR